MYITTRLFISISMRLKMATLCGVVLYAMALMRMSSPIIRGEDMPFCQTSRLVHYWNPANCRFHVFVDFIPVSLSSLKFQWIKEKCSFLFCRTQLFLILTSRNPACIESSFAMWVEMQHPSLPRWPSPQNQQPMSHSQAQCYSQRTMIRSLWLTLQHLSWILALGCCRSSQWRLFMW